MAKPHLEFAPIDMNTGWQTPPGYKEGFKQKILATDLDEAGKRGSRSRLLRIEPGAFSDKPVVSANCLSKGVLRSALYDFCRLHEDDGNLHYFPAYEIVNCLTDYPYVEDNRHLTNKALNEIMNCFAKYYIKGTTCMYI